MFKDPYHVSRSLVSSRSLSSRLPVDAVTKFLQGFSNLFLFSAWSLNMLWKIDCLYPSIFIAVSPLEKLWFSSANCEILKEYTQSRFMVPIDWSQSNLIGYFSICSTSQGRSEISLCLLGLIEDLPSGHDQRHWKWPSRKFVSLPIEMVDYSIDMWNHRRVFVLESAVLP